jgi:hypothetical protein
MHIPPPGAVRHSGFHFDQMLDQLCQNGEGVSNLPLSIVIVGLRTMKDMLG